MKKGKLFSGLSRLFICTLLSFLLLPGSQVMGEWSCDYIPEPIIDEVELTPEISFVTYTINLSNTPSELGGVYSLKVEFNPAQMSFISIDFSGCLPDSVDASVFGNTLDLIGSSDTPLPVGSSGCFCTVTFIKSTDGEIDTPIIIELGGAFCPGGDCWCLTPTLCSLVITPPSLTSIKTEETLQLEATNFYCPDECSQSYTWEITEQNSEGSVIDSNGNYTAGSTQGDDTIMVTDACGKIQTTKVPVLPSLVIHECTLPQLDPIVLSGNCIDLCVKNNFCDSDPALKWSLESTIGSTIDPATGRYCAGNQFSSCVDAEDTVTLTANCPNKDVSNEGQPPVRKVQTTLTVPPCAMTVRPPSATMTPGNTQLFTATSECCENKPCYTWSVYSWSLNAAGVTGNSCNEGHIDANGLYRAATCDAEEDVIVTDTCNDNVMGTAPVRVEYAQCLTNTQCDDGRFCNGTESCVVGFCRLGTPPCGDDGLYCNGEETCDEKSDECVSGDAPCPEECDEGNDVCTTRCTEDADCNDELFCNGEETCVDEICQPGTDPCPEGVECDEENDTCFDDVTTTTSIQGPLPGPLDVRGDPIKRSNSRNRISLLRLNGDDTTNFSCDSVVSVTPAGEVELGVQLQLSKRLIWQIVTVLPGEADATIAVTVTTGTEVVIDNNVIIEMDRRSTP